MHDSSEIWRTIQALVSGMSLLLTFSGCGERKGYEVLGNVIFLRGTVTIKSGKENAGHPQSATLASKLSVGDQIETSSGATAALSLIPGIFVKAEAETEMAIEQLRVQKRGDAMVDAMESRLATLHQNRGVIYASLPNVGSGRCELTVQTDLGTLVAQRGAIVVVRLTSEAVRVICVDGQVHWSSAAGGHLDEIPQGYFRDYNRKAVANGNLKSEPTPASEEAGAQEDVAFALEAAAAFDEFALRVRNAPPLQSSIPIERPTLRPP
jgi:hypothetical protein